MVRIILLLVLLSASLSGCKEEDTGCPVGDCRFVLHRHSRIAIDADPGSGTFASIAEGDKLVFEYHFIFDDDPRVADDEYSDHLLFEIPQDQDSFQIEGKDQLDAANVWFRRLCYCFNTDFNPASSGTITGKKLTSGAWQVSIDVTIDYDSYSLSVNRNGIYLP